MRRVAVETLSRVGDASIVPDLLQKLRDWDGNVRLAAVNALKQVADASIVPDLIQALRDEDDYVRWGQWRR